MLLGMQHGIRPSGLNHDDAVLLLCQKETGEDTRKGVERLVRIINKKNMVEYEGRKLSESEAKKLSVDALSNVNYS